MVRSSPLIFTTTRRKPELIVPAEPTPRELKPLSDIDDQEGLRFHVSFVQIYQARRANKDDVVLQGNNYMTKNDPVRVIREALAKALVYYYPWAGRMREVGPRRKLVVDCTGEGVVFVEAEADVRVEDLVPHLHKPFPCFKELLFKDHVSGSSDILGCPSISIQVRLVCVVSARFKFNPPIPTGYYGNTMAYPVAISTVEKISTNGLDYALNLVKKAKAKVTEEYTRSVADLTAVQGRPHPTVLLSRVWAISDNTRIGYEKIDFGWGKAVYGGPASGLIRDGPDRLSFFLKGSSSERESSVLVPICLPIVMERFAREVQVISDVYSKL